MTTLTQLTLDELVSKLNSPPSHNAPLYALYTNLTTNEITTRTWRERLFSLPWRPHKKYKWVQRPALYLLTPTITVLAHPSFSKDLRRLPQYRGTIVSPKKAETR